MSAIAPSLQNDLSHRLRTAYDFIKENLHREDLTPAGVAGALDISVRQLHVLFAQTDQSFSRYVVSCRLELARLQLDSFPDRAVIDIALACGFKSSSVFYRSFRDAFGMNPSSYRKSLRERIGSDDKKVSFSR